MAHPELLIEKATCARALSFARDLIALTKPRITALVLLTGAAGFCLAPGRVPALALGLAALGTTFIVGAANALNMWIERDTDAKMARTKTRPLPAGRMSPGVALAFALALAILSLPLLFAVNLATGLLGLAALVVYVLAYTPLKRRTHLALLVGAVPGAIPPLLGWSAATGTISRGGVLLFTLLLTWQVPHFAAIAVFRADEYRRAGLQVISVQHGERAARRMIAVGAALVVAASLAFVPLGYGGRAYFGAATVLGALFLMAAFRGVAATGDDFHVERWAKGVFALSIPYLALLLVVLLFDRA